MNDTLIIAIISFLGTVAGSYIVNNKNTAIIQEQVKNIKEDIAILSQRVDKHNNLVERMVVVEQSTKSAHKRLDDMAS